MATCEDETVELYARCTHCNGVGAIETFKDEEWAWDECNECKGSAMQTASEQQVLQALSVISRYDEHVELSVQELDQHGNLTGYWHYATPQEIIAGHPKCDACKFCRPVMRPKTQVILHHRCTNQTNHSFGHTINPETDYCSKWIADDGSPTPVVMTKDCGCQPVAHDLLHPLHEVMFKPFIDAQQPKESE